ncbi:MAG: hypothetical protein V3575_01005 [Candidatus Absconditabacteria bacterium]
MNNIPKSVILEGKYGNKEIIVDIYSIEQKNKLVINVHGTYGSKNGSNNKYKNFAISLQNSHIANVILYQSSRLDVPNLEYTKGSTDKFVQKQGLFVGKTINDEIEELKTVIDYAINNSKELFRIEGNELEITLNGNSLGGMLSFIVASNYPQIKNIVTVGTGISLEYKDIPILCELPSPNFLKNKIQEFLGKTMFCRGTDDALFDEKSFEEFANCKEENKQVIKLQGVDHSFGKLNGELSTIPYEKVFGKVSKLLK